jgi:hypothetical protein
MSNLFVNVKTWRNSRREALETALTPTAYQDGGQLEDIKSQTTANAEAIGKLLALLVERKALTLDEAAEIANVTDELTLVD